MNGFNTSSTFDCCVLRPAIFDFISVLIAELEYGCKLLCVDDFPVFYNCALVFVKTHPTAMTASLFKLIDERFYFALLPFWF